MANNQENMQNAESTNRSAGGNGMNTWEMQGNVQGNGMSPMMMSRQMRQGDEEDGSGGASKQIRKMKERKRAAHKAKREQYEKAKKEACEDLTRISGGRKVTGDKESLKEVLADIMRKKTYEDAAEAIIAAIDCRWGCCEKEAEDAAREAARSVEEEEDE